jgi:hypothetical protein
MSDPVEQTYEVGQRVHYDGPGVQSDGTVESVDGATIGVLLDQQAYWLKPGQLMLTSWPYLRPLP